MNSNDMLQAKALRLFIALWLARPAWSGALLLGVGLSEAGRALAFASLAAGAAGLFLESDSAALRAAQREGCCTFTVSTLEEAVRALKNEVRQGRAITIALRGDVSANLAEMARRGIQPDVIAYARPPQENELSSFGVLIERGGLAVQHPELAAFEAAMPLDEVVSWAMGSAWRFRTGIAANLAERRTLDREYIQQAESAGNAEPVALAARRWLRVAPTLFNRSLERAYLAESSSGT